MLKFARKPSSDPVQEKLRLSKENWNKDVSAFIAENVLFRRDITKFNNDLIHFKKLMNGAANKFYMQRSYITHPIPADPATIAGVLAEDFNKFSQHASELSQKLNALVQRANAISAQQIEYSNTRRKKRNEPNNQQLSLPGISATINYNLISYGSNPLSRFIARRLIPTTGDSQESKEGRYRLRLLEDSINFYRDLDKFQEKVVSQESDAVAKYTSDFSLNILKKWNELSFNINKGEKLVVEAAPVKSESLNIDSAIKEFTASFLDQGLHLKISQESYKKLEKLLKDYRNPTLSLDDKTKAAEKFIQAWSSIKNEMNMPTDISEVDDYLEKIAQPSITKWINKKRTEKKAKIKELQIYDLIENIKKNIDNLMDLVEKAFDYKEIINIRNKIENDISEIVQLINEGKASLRGLNPSVILQNLDSNVSGLNEDQKKKVEDSLRMQMMRNMYRQVGI